MGSVISGLCLIWGGGEAWGALPLLPASPMVFVLHVVSGEALAGTRGAGCLWIDNLCKCFSARVRFAWGCCRPLLVEVL